MTLAVTTTLLSSLLALPAPRTATSAAEDKPNAEPAAPAQPTAEAEQEPAAVERPTVRAKKAHKRRGCRAFASPEYRRMVRNWRKVPEIPAPRYRDGFRDLTFYSVNLGERIRLFPFLADGSLDPQAVVDIAHILRDKHTDAEHPMEARLIKLLYRLANRFKARQITVISGYRESAADEQLRGNHSRGRAIDIAIPGVSIANLAKEARTLGHVGVGLYPTSGFVHLDVRDGPSYFWIDRSGPGLRGCPFRVAAEVGARADRKWRPADDDPAPVRDRKGALLGESQSPEPATCPPLFTPSRPTPTPSALSPAP